MPTTTSLDEIKGEFKAVVAQSISLKEETFRIRHQVYCKERGYEDCDNGMEIDIFDKNSEHILLRQRSTGRAVGTVRLVKPMGGRSSLAFPMRQTCPDSAFRHLPLSRTGEISRFAISKELRDAECAANPLLRLGLMQGVVLLSRQLGLTHWCALMEPKLLRLLRASGIHFQPVGPLVEYHGLRQPCWSNINDILDRLGREKPQIWNYVTDYGRLWHGQGVMTMAS